MDAIRRWWYRKELAEAKRQADSEAWWAYVATERANPAIEVTSAGRYHLGYRTVPPRIILP